MHGVQRAGRRVHLGRRALAGSRHGPADRAADGADPGVPFPPRPRRPAQPSRRRTGRDDGPAGTGHPLLDGVARVHVNRWGDGSSHLHLWFLARPYGRLQLRGTFLSLWDSILPPISEEQWRENLALVAAWLAEFGGRPLAEPPRIRWQAPSSIAAQSSASASVQEEDDAIGVIEAAEEIPEPVGGEDAAAQPTDEPTGQPGRR